ncbi:MAG: hypothetical protein AVDCRST_MAG59-3904, partial [uncultured Thermomicrobiales bacterium]
ELHRLADLRGLGGVGRQHAGGHQQPDGLADEHRRRHPRGVPRRLHLLADHRGRFQRRLQHRQLHRRRGRRPDPAGDHPHGRQQGL